MEELIECLKPKHNIGEGEWSDLSGLIAPKTEIQKLIKNIERKELASLEDIELEFRNLHNNYYEYEWIWASELLVEKTGKKIDDLILNDVISLIKKMERKCHRIG